jgi:hypothetical protein
MYKILSSIPMFLLFSAAHAAKELDAPAAPVETVGTIYIVIFGIIFIGMIVGFFVYLWMSDDKKPEDK